MQRYVTSNATDFAIQHADAGDVHVVRVVGEFGLESNRQFEEVWRDSVVGERRPTVLDLSGVRFMDSTALSTTLGALREAWGAAMHCWSRDPFSRRSHRSSRSRASTASSSSTRT